jgi:hypothetical protein
MVSPEIDRFFPTSKKASTFVEAFFGNSVHAPRYSRVPVEAVERHQ